MINCKCMFRLLGFFLKKRKLKAFAAEFWESFAFLHSKRLFSSVSSFFLISGGGAADCCPRLHVQLLRQVGCEVCLFTSCFDSSSWGQAAAGPHPRNQQMSAGWHVRADIHEGSTMGDSRDGAGPRAEGAWEGGKPGQSGNGHLVQPEPWQHLCLLPFLNGIERFENIMFTACL